MGDVNFHFKYENCIIELFHVYLMTVSWKESISRLRSKEWHRCDWN
ncbi:hypothetical protein ACJIZ3_024470 [Penstemon smallii]|uniref:Uncharacterized protein n=1 Tax=Penstemon smallii TaxID=265156 RepID=A0ABD3TRW9_9LAMI